MPKPTPPTHILHHAEGPPSVPADIYDAIFHGDAKAGDWYWIDIVHPDPSGKTGEQTHRALHILVPDLRGEAQGTLAAKGLELIEVYPRHAKNNWARPGRTNGWDGNVDEPTLTPSIYVGGDSKKPGWHGFFEKGQLRDA